MIQPKCKAPFLFGFPSSVHEQCVPACRRRAQVVEESLYACRIRFEAGTRSRTWSNMKPRCCDVICLRWMLVSGSTMLYQFLSSKRNTMQDVVCITIDICSTSSNSCRGNLDIKQGIAQHTWSQIRGIQIKVQADPDYPYLRRCNWLQVLQVDDIPRIHQHKSFAPLLDLHKHPSVYCDGRSYSLSG